MSNIPYVKRRHGCLDNGEHNLDYSTYLPRDSISSHSRDTAVPKPFQDLNTGFYARMFWLFLCSIILFLGRRVLIPFWDHAHADEEDIAFLWCYVEGFAHGENCSERNRVGGEVRVGYWRTL